MIQSLGSPKVTFLMLSCREKLCAETRSAASTEATCFVMGGPARRCERPLCAVVTVKCSGSLEAYPPLWPLDESVTLLPWFKFGVKTIMATSRDSRRVITQQLLRPPHTKPRRLFQRQRVDTSPQEGAAPSKGEVNFGFNPLQSASHTQSNRRLSSGGPLSPGSYSTVSLLARAPRTLITPPPHPPPAQTTKACSDDWPSGGLALRKCSVDKSKPVAPAAGSGPLQAG